jgi:nicotinic acid mononucleotide adenylyltransferase
MRLSPLQRKAQEDLYYQHMVRAGANDNALLQAGFFDDGLLSSVRSYSCWAPTMPTTPFGKLLASAVTSEGHRQEIVLLSTGSFSPVHSGHLAMMESAKAAWEAQGAKVLGGYLSPSHDSYVSQKQQGAAALHCEHRIALLEEAVADSSWLSVCPWEARYAPCALNFTDVIDRLQEHLQHVLGRSIQVAYVFGADNGGFLEAFRKRGAAVCVSRTGYSDPAIPDEARPRCVLAFGQPGVVSSTLVREGQTRHVPPIAQARYLSLRAPAFSNSSGPREDVPLYLVRMDTAYGVAPWERAASSADRFEKGLIQVLQQALATGPKPPRVVPLDLNKQQALLDNLVEPSVAVLNLDCCTQSKWHLGLSRQFEMCGGQLFSQQMVARPGLSPVRSQISELPSQKWLVVDDDRATGTTHRAVTRLLTEAGHSVTGFAYLNELPLAQAGTPSPPIADIVDARDFLLGSQDGGLVVLMPDGQLGRVPYMLPFVNLTFRAKLPAPSLLASSIALWQLNARWFEEHARHIRVKHSDPACQRVLLGLGFSIEQPLSSVARHFADWLQHATGVPAARSALVA